MQGLEKMNNAMRYICECRWASDTKDCFGDELNVGFDLDTVKVIRDLSVFLGKAQVYSDKNEIENLEMTEKAFWNLFDEEDFDLSDYEDWIETFETEKK